MKFLTIALIATAMIIGYLFLHPFTASPIPDNVKYVTICDEYDTNCHPTGLPYQNPKLSIDIRVDDLLKMMTVAEKIGQMALIEKNSINDLNDIAKYGLGALMSGGGGHPNDNTPAGWLAMIKNFQSYSQKTRLSIPLLYGIDANHGHSNIPEATIFPHFIGLGASKDPELVKKIAQATAEEVAATGINWVYSPNLDVAQDFRWGRTYETFGSDPILIGNLGQAFIDGLQSSNQNSLTMAAAAKHYLGNGASEWGSSINKNFFIDQGNSKLSEKELRKTHLEPFKQAVNAGVKSVMVGLNKWNNKKISANKYLITDVLKKELDFKGFVFSDWYGIFEKEPNKYEALVKSINSGVDMIMLPYDYKFFSDSLMLALTKNDITQSRIDEAVRRILKVKFEIGLFDNSAATTANLTAVGSKSHKNLARLAVRKSLVLLKNNNVVPISKKTGTILIAGSSANNLGKQSGGWTAEWQGIDGNWIPGITILKGIQHIAQNADVKYDINANFIGQKSLADIGIAVVGEKPYAEGWGDNEYPQLTSEDIQTINNLKKISKKIIVIIVSGRPLDIKEYAANWDAIIAAWLPGTEGQGVADVLFGDYPFTGILPVKWEL